MGGGAAWYSAPGNPQVTPPPDLPRYAADMFAAPLKECDIVMKGGITSGIVYPYAILEMAKVYRFRSIGGTSAGAIAAALAAAAEYARTVRGDPGGFVRFQELCDEVPARLSTFFQPAARFAPLMTHLMRAQRWRRHAWAWAAPLAFPLTTVVGLGLGAGLMGFAEAGAAGIVLGAIVGAVVALVARVARLVLVTLPRSGFGLCTGLTTRGGAERGLTDWLHAAIQRVAFGDAGADRDPLTFGDLAGGDLAGTDGDARTIDLRMITTNLSMRRPHTPPVLGLSAGFDLGEWRALFPPGVMAYLDRATKPFRRAAWLRAFPDPRDLPILVAARMSLSFPLLFTAVPAYVRDYASAALLRATGGRPKIRKAPIWFADGGISSNFPIHLFDALLPSRPTFALSLDDLPAGAVGPERVFIPQGAGQGVGLPAREIGDLGGFVGSIFGAAKDWQDQLLATMPGQRERIAHVLLSPDEGGLNPSMPPALSRTLMHRGLTVGRAFADGALNFDEHRWRRALNVYEQLEGTTAATEARWRGGFGAWLLDYMGRPRSYKGVTGADRTRIHDRLGAFARLAERFAPPIANRDDKLPRPSGRLRIGPDY